MGGTEDPSLTLGMTIFDEISLWRFI